MAEFTLIGIGGAVLVSLIVQALKAVFPGLEGSRWLIPIALAVGVLLSVLNQVGQIVPGFQTWFEVVLIGLMAGFTAMGLYDTAKTALKR